MAVHCFSAHCSKRRVCSSSMTGSTGSVSAGRRMRRLARMTTEPAAHHAISFAVQHPKDDRLVLIVLRPPDDAELPNVWGLPAGSVRAGESAEEAVVRAGREKLGVVLAPLKELGEGSTERREYTLRMKLFAARIVDGSPSVPQPYPD